MTKRRLASYGLNLVGVASGGELAQFGRIAFEISRAVAAIGVQHNDAVVGHGIDFLLQLIQ